MAERALENFLFFFKFLYFSRGHKCFPKRQREREEATLPTGCGHTATASPPFLHLIGILVHFLSHQSQDSNHSQSRGIQPLTTRPQVQLTLETFYLGEISPFRTNGHHSHICPFEHFHTMNTLFQTAPSKISHDGLVVNTMLHDVEATWEGPGITSQGLHLHVKHMYVHDLDWLRLGKGHRMGTRLEVAFFLLWMNKYINLKHTKILLHQQIV